MSTCLNNCGRNAPGSASYCKDSCQDYCAQEDRRDGLSGSISTDGAEFGWRSGAKLPNAPLKPSVYGEDLPPGLPDVFGINTALRKAVTGGNGENVQALGGARDYSDATPGGILDPNRFRAKAK